MISTAWFQANNTAKSGYDSRNASGPRTGMCEPGVSRPCFAGVVWVTNEMSYGPNPQTFATVALFAVAP